MQTSIPSFAAAMRRPRPRIALAAALVALAANAPARATLGQDVGSIEADRLQMRAASAPAQVHALFTVVSFTQANGTQVREYLSASGQVFALAWNGPVQPDLHTLLGAEQHAAVLASPQRSREGLAHRRVVAGSVVVETGGHIRALHGRAWRTDAFPAGVGVNDVR